LFFFFILFKKDHPYSKFGTGNLSTLKHEPEKLGLNVRDELIKFHTKYYSANLMSLCLLGKESIDELEKYAIEMFSPIKNKNLEPIKFPNRVYDDKSLAKVFEVVPVQDLRQLSINWEIPDHIDYYDSNPSAYISHLLGHEGEGSLLSELKRKGWCNNLYSGQRREALGFQFYNLTVDLTEDGGENIDSIIKNVYQYLNMLINNKPEKWIFDELLQLGKISFDYKDKERPESCVSKIASDLHQYKMEDVLRIKYYQTEFSPERIKDLYTYLTPEKMKVAVISKKYKDKTDLTEQWYGTQYRIRPIEPNEIKSYNECGLNDSFHLPAKNPFIPQDLSLVKHNTDDLPKLPRIINRTCFSNLWFKEDTKFLLPKAVAKFELRNPICYFDPVNVNMSNMYIELLKDSLTEVTYSAELAGLKYDISPTNFGINVSVSGFSDKMDVLLDIVFNQISTLKVNKERFNILKESYKRNLLNFEAEQTYKHAIYYTTLALSEHGWSKHQLLETIDDFTVDDLQRFIPKILTQGLFVSSLMFGNLTKERAIQFEKICIDKLESACELKPSKIRSLPSNQLKNFRQVKIEDGGDYVFIKNNTVHKTCGIEVYFQCAEQSTRNNALIELFCQIINEASFNVLRTQEQLGYIVASGVRSYGGAHGVRFIIQSDKAPNYLDERIENFIELTKETLNKMNDDEFKVHIESLSLSKLEEPKKISQQSNIYWNEIVTRNFNFDREPIEVEDIKKLTKNDIVQFFEVKILIY
jgi:insulysin